MAVLLGACSTSSEIDKSEGIAAAGGIEFLDPAAIHTITVVFEQPTTTRSSTPRDN